jgi:hypothetical protein
MPDRGYSDQSSKLQPPTVDASVACIHWLSVTHVDVHIVSWIHHDVVGGLLHPSMRSRIYKQHNIDTSIGISEPELLNGRFFLYTPT